MTLECGIIWNITFFCIPLNYSTSNHMKTRAIILILRSMLLFILFAECTSCRHKDVSIIPVESVKISPSSRVMTIGEVFSFQASIIPVGATEKNVNWVSSNPNVAEVSRDGEVKAKTEGEVTITASAGGKFASADVSVVKKRVEVESIGLATHDISLIVGEEATLTVSVSPSDATDKTLSWSSSNPDIAIVEEGTVHALSVGQTFVTVSSSNGKSDECIVSVKERFEAVDMGLSVMWANMNIGSVENADGGYYYAWGELMPKTDYSWETYSFAEQAGNGVVKYGDISDLYVLTQDDDVAFSEKGDGWRIPTKHDFKELIDNCDLVWSDSPAGYVLTSVINANTIFLPAAGYMEGGEKQSGMFSLARYWTSSLGHYDNEAFGVSMFKSMGMTLTLTSGNRAMGYSVRPVYGPRQTVPEPKIKVNEIDLDFGDVSVGDTAEITVEVLNIGEAELIYYVDFPEVYDETESLSDNFIVKGNSPGAAEVHQVTAGNSGTFTLLYRPVAVGEEKSRFVIYSNAINGYKCVTVRGTAFSSGGTNEDIGYGDWDF